MKIMVSEYPEHSRVFLTAEWRHLAMLNYEIDPLALAPFVPAGTELDSWNGKFYVSMVGFLFLRTRIFGVPIPFHRNFEEVNLRFYVWRKADDGWRRGVVFIKEIVPLTTIAFVARKFYNEPYIALPMTHQITTKTSATQSTQPRHSEQSAEYAWRFRGEQHSLKMTVSGEAQPVQEGSEAEFITEHYWGYNAQRDGSTLEYRVEHPRWRTYGEADSKLNDDADSRLGGSNVSQIGKTEKAELHCDVATLYGERFRESLSQNPSSAFLAEGSPITVYRGVKL